MIARRLYGENGDVTLGVNLVKHSRYEVEGMFLTW